MEYLKYENSIGNIMDSTRCLLILIIIIALISSGCINNDNENFEAKILQISHLEIGYGGTINFKGSGSGGSGGVNGYQWRSSIDGIISKKAEFSISNLSVGNHTIYFKVMDGSNKWSKEVKVDIQITLEIGSFDIKKLSNDNYRVRVTLSRGYWDWSNFAINLVNDTGDIYYQQNVQLVNQSGDIIGLESEETWSEKNPSGNDDLAARAYDIENEADTCSEDNQTKGIFPVVFYDNDHDDEFTAGDEFIIRSSGYNSSKYLASAGWSFELVFKSIDHVVNTILLKDD